MTERKKKGQEKDDESEEGRGFRPILGEAGLLLSRAFANATTLVRT
jgi:hypothetical protein